MPLKLFEFHKQFMIGAFLIDFNLRLFLEKKHQDQCESTHYDYYHIRQLAALK